MRRQTNATVLRWLFIGFWLALDWSAVGVAVGEGRRVEDGMGH
jgi:hypothetical protein